jgi:hypothetical protein
MNFAYEFDTNNPEEATHYFKKLQIDRLSNIAIQKQNVVDAIFTVEIFLTTQPIRLRNGVRTAGKCA